MAPYSATSRELSGAAKASLRLGLGHPLYTPQAYSLLPPPSIRLSPVLGYCLPYYHIVLFHRLPCDLYSACLLPTIYLGDIASHSNRSYTLPGSSRQQAEGFALKHFTILHFLPRTIAYTAKQLHQQTPGRSHPHNGVGIRIRSSTLPRTIAYAAEQLHQQLSGRSHPPYGW